MKNADNQFGNSSEDRLPYDNPDPIIQDRDESDSQKGNIQPVEAVLRAQKSMPLSDVSMYSGRYANSQNHNKTI